MPTELPIIFENSYDLQRKRVLELLQSLIERVEDRSKPPIQSIVVVTTTSKMQHRVRHTSGLPLATTLGQLAIAQDHLLQKAKRV